MNLLTFYSEEPHFTLEKSGLKPNTIRQVNETDPRWPQLVRLLADSMQGIKTLGTITIQKRELDDEGRLISFTRAITNVSFWQGWYIISWKHEAD